MRSWKIHIAQGSSIPFSIISEAFDSFLFFNFSITSSDFFIAAFLSSWA
jgi:hypothetical protein